MEFTNEFTIPVGVDEAFALLTDIERVAPCMPGATLEEAEGGTYSGRMKVKVGPMSLTYAGTAAVTEQDSENRTARIQASGRENRGSGTASADVHASIEPANGGSRVVVTTNIDVTGKPAQFGRGVMADVGSRIIDRFADNLRAELASEQVEPAPITSPETARRAPSEPHGHPTAALTAEAPRDASTDPSRGPRKIQHRPPKDEALDLFAVGGNAAAKRLVPVLLALGGLLLWRRWRRSSIR